MIQRVFQHGDSAYEDICSSGYFSSSTDTVTRANESLTISEFISATLHSVCSCSHDILLTSAMSELFMLPVIYHALHLPTPVVGPTHASATPLPLLQNMHVDTIMSHPIARWAAAHAICNHPCEHRAQIHRQHAIQLGAKWSRNFKQQQRVLGRWYRHLTHRYLPMCCTCG